MTWVILLIKHPDNGWYVNYLENKLNKQINDCNLQYYINVVVYEPRLLFHGDYVSVIDKFIEISDDFISVAYKSIIENKPICVGLKGIINIDNERIVFNNIENKENEQLLKVSKINPIKLDFITNKIKNILIYLGSETLNILPECSVDSPVIFLSETKKKESISIIVTAYKTENYIEECLDSIENQTYFINNDEFEVLVGIDACNDTFEKLESIKDKYRNLKIYMMSENQGTYITTNTLIDFVKYENVIRFDSDDIMTPNLVSEVIRNKKDNDIIIIGSVSLIGSKIGSEFKLTEGIIFFKKSMMDNVAGGYRPWLCSADAELINRLVNIVKITQLKKVLFYRRIHGNSLTQREGTRYKSKLRESYKKEIKGFYRKDEIKIDRVVNKVVNSNVEFENRIFIKKPVSIFITAYNTEKYIEECLDSIEKQSYFEDYNEFEVLVGIDNCKETLNKILEIKHKYRNFRVFMMDSNKGTYVTSNTMLDLVKYQNIIRFDSDDIMRKNMIERIMYFSDDYDIVKFGYYNFYNDDINNISYNKFHFPHGVVLYKKTIFDKFGGYQPWLCAADTELLVRANDFENLNIKEMRERLFLRRQHGDSLTRRVDTQHGSNLRESYKKLIGNHKSYWIDKETNTYIEY